MTIQGQAFGQATPPAPPLPPEIAFLARHGVEREALDRAAALAAELGVTADAALLRTGGLPEEAFYRALAAELRLPFLEGEVALDAALARFPENVQRGLAPLAWEGPGRRFAMAPAGEPLAWLMTSERRPSAALAITTPRALGRAVLAARGEAVAEEAANGLTRAAPHHSYKGATSLEQRAFAVAVLTGTAGFATLSPEALVAVAVSATTLAFFGAVTLRMAAAFQAHPCEPPAGLPTLLDRDLPTYSVVVALYREHRVLPQLVASLTALDYPAPKVDIKLVLEADDAETQAALAAMRLPGNMDVVVAPPGLPRTKPRALNVVLPLLGGELTVVYDAEDVPDPGQLRAAAATFARCGPEVACLQSRLVIDNTRDSWLTRFFTVEYASLFDVINPALAGWGFPVPLGGTSTHFRGIMEQTHQPTKL